MEVISFRPMANSEAGMSSDVTQVSGGEYQVFLSFRRSDTRHGFTDFLYHGLVDAGVCVFKEDDELPSDEVIGENLLHAINNSMLYIPIFSRTYASSKRCLQELALIVDNVSKLEDQKSIIPIFLDVEPEDVKLRTTVYSTAFEKHKEDFPKEVEAWRKALAEVDEIKGWNVKKDQSQAAIVKLVVENVLEKLDIERKSVTEHLIGLDDRVKDLTKLLDVNHRDVRLIGIHGKGGIGKTTVAKVIFNKLSSHFGKCCSFLENIRESSLTKEGILQLQRKLLFDIVGFGSIEQLMDSEQAMRRIGDTLSTKNVLIVLDDVDKKEHINKLLGGYSLHSGSRIIITTRNKIVLNVKGLKIVCYEMLKMDDASALRLFCQHAFGREIPSDICHGLSSKIVSVMGGLPLAIEVISSLLNGKDEAFWKEMLVRLRDLPKEDIMETLRISYDNLDKYQQQIFLDIACFLFNENKTDAIYMWADCQFYPIRGLKVLTDRCLIKILDNDKIWMHDQLIELGRRVVRQESPFNPGKRSRLWIAQEALEIIRTRRKKDKIQALKISRSTDSIEITNEEFERLQNLRFLELHWGTYAGDFARCYSNLRWFTWHSPRDFRADNMYLDRLVVCKLDTIDFKDDSKAWDLIKRAQNLKVLSVTRCSSITTIPDFSKCSHLERLTLTNCFSLERIESFIGDLVSLIELKIEECRGLTELPTELGALVKLKHFSLSGCGGLRELPSSLENLTSLTELDLSRTSIAKPPGMPLLHYVQEIPLDTSNFESKSDKTEGGEKAIAWWTSKESCKQEMEQTEGGEKATAWWTCKQSCKQEMEQTNTEGEEKAKAWWKSNEFFKQETEMTEGGEKATACWRSKESCKREMEQTKTEGGKKATAWWKGKEFCKQEMEETKGGEKATARWTSKESCKHEMEQTEGREKATDWWTNKESCKQGMEQTDGGEKATALWTSKESCKQEIDQTEGGEKATAWWTSKESFKQEMEETKGGEKATAWWTSKESCNEEMEEADGNISPRPSSFVREQKKSDDEYNWRKYGQKQVKGSKYPRSYYKCTFPGCLTKKKVERSLDGHITEIVYSGTHNHPKPPSTRRLSSQSIQPPSSNPSCLENPDQLASVVCSEKGLQDSSASMGDEDFEENSHTSNSASDVSESEAKRLRGEKEYEGNSASGNKTVREPRVVVQTMSETDIFDDGYRWRKYGQKVVKGNPNPRSYFKCTHLGCPARKYVERASHDLRAVITTYEGNHNHDPVTVVHDVPAVVVGKRKTDALSMDARGIVSSSQSNTTLSPETSATNTGTILRSGTNKGSSSDKAEPQASRPL